MRISISEDLGQQGYLTPELIGGRLADEYWSPKNEVVKNARVLEDTSVRNGNLIFVTSTKQCDEKIFTSLNLAMSLATGQDTNALLVDCDFIAYSFTNRVNLLSATGLVDALLNPNMDIGSIMIKTDIPKLRIIPKGRHNPNALELLTSEKMQVLALELSTRYPDRFIIFDGPPLLFGNHGRALTATAGQILLVVAEGKTPTKDVKYAISLLGEDKMIGLVVNKSSCRCSSRF